MRHRIRSAGIFRGDDRVQGDHSGCLTAVGAHIDIGDILRRGTVLRLRLGLHSVDPAEFDEVVDIEIAEECLHGVEDIGDRNPQGLGSFPIHVGIQSRRGDAKVSTCRADRRILSNLCEEFLRDRRKGSEISTSRILYLHGEPTRCAQPSDRRSIKGENQRLWNFCEFLVGGPDERLDMLIWSFAFIPGYQGREHGRAIGTTRAEHEILASQRFGSINDRIPQGVLLELAEYRIGPLQ